MYLYDNKERISDYKILISGINSNVSQNLYVRLRNQGYMNVKGITSRDLDLREQGRTYEFFSAYKPDIVFHVAARTAGVKENALTPWDILHDNLMMECNVFEACVRNKVKKIIWVSSDSALPYSEDEKPVTENDLFTSYVDRMRESYGFAKAMGAKMLEYIEKQERVSTVSLFPCYIYGNIKKGLVYSLFKDVAMAKKEEMSEVVVWGKADTKIRLIHSMDVADALCFALEHDMGYREYIIAPECGVTKRDLAYMIAQSVGYKGTIVFDGKDGVKPPTNAFSNRLYLEGWSPQVSLEEGLERLNKYIKEAM